MVRNVNETNGRMMLCSCNYEESWDGWMDGRKETGCVNKEMGRDEVDETERQKHRRSKRDERNKMSEEKCNSKG